MTDVFISYARRDGKPFVERLLTALSGQGRDVWVDWEDIPRAVNFLDEIYAGIEATNTFIFVMTEGALASEICSMEVAHAIRHNKRLIPLVLKDIDDKGAHRVWAGKDWEPLAQANWQTLRHLNWLFFRDTDDFEAALHDLLQTIETDIDYIRQHTRLLVRAREWVTRGHRPGFLLQGEDLTDAESWLNRSVEKTPAPTDLHREYIAASRAARVRRQRITALSVAVTLIIGALATIATWQSVLAGRNALAAEQNAATAIIAQAEAQTQASIAQTQAAIATIAQGEALIQASTATFAERLTSVQLAAANKVSDIINRGGIRRETDPFTRTLEQLQIAAVAPDHQTIEFVSGRYADFVLNADIRWTARADQDTNALDCGFIFRYTNADNFYQIAINRQRLLRFRKREAGEWGSWVYGNARGLRANSINPQNEIANTLTLLVAGNRYSVFINGEYAFQFQDERLDKQRTRTGLIAAAPAESQQADCRFNDVWIRDYTRFEVTCIGSPPSRLEQGISARVVEGGTSNRLRSGPSTRTGEVVALIPPGALMTVRDGPVCDADLNLTWWQVEYQGNIGWTAEGQGDSYFIEPQAE